MSVLDFPMPVAPFTSATSKLEFTDDDIDLGVIERKIAEKQREEASKKINFCSKQPWWECNGDKSGGVCQMNTSNQCVPIGLDDSSKESYFKRWLRFYGPLYAMHANVSQRKRAHSISRPATPATTAPLDKLLK